ncbi:cytochrome c oxidase accessory protein CcoG [Leptospira licerasiae]|uniref:Cytochrome c oxidase accessory protein CcoG n=1 Tax=Leptospira licerasiae str. MMD4847 TaxID=1049971 RepID=A0ABP2RH03_9LEPT|nr:cytochrome c oxidase accessory protein CcoG [Leptospira licerasiae]EIE00473.1 cytochrome c oxidase accessory protein CcoG [Leptospira licerasiae serovar Varillal str. VAR 010]EJZ43573.1 cytochrome c oxidase accessory protein CcoG [Leptospira licerasiae str. MMD4847]
MIISRPMQGKIRTARNYVQVFLVLLFFITPWIRWDGFQVIRLDIPDRKFFLFGHIFIPQEGYFLHLFLISAGLSLFLFTTLIGRVWCGWACPQTIYTDIFDWIGRKIQDSKYGKKDANPALVILTHISWIIVSFAASFAWISYFIDPYKMIGYFQNPNLEFPTWSLFLGFFTFAMYADIAFIREQFCKYACPYARFQTVMMDNHSVNITYDYVRGEPRRKGTTKIGDCTACNMCLVVCPTGIDIREGANPWCIACGKCSDACTKQMAKENKKTLIGYWSENEIAEKGSPVRWIRPRTVVYGLFLILAISAIGILLSSRVPLYLSVLPDRNIQPMMVQNGVIRNFYEVQMQNLTSKDRTLKFEIENSDLQGERKILVGGTEEATVELKGNSEERYRLFIELKIADQDAQKRSHDIKLKVIDIQDFEYSKSTTVPFLLPVSISGWKIQNDERIVHGR